MAARSKPFSFSSVWQSVRPKN